MIGPPSNPENRVGIGDRWHVGGCHRGAGTRSVSSVQGETAEFMPGGIA